MTQYAQYVAGFIVGMLAGTAAAAIIAYQWYSAVREEVYQQGISHGRELERMAKQRVRFEDRTAKTQGE